MTTHPEILAAFPKSRRGIGVNNWTPFAVQQFTRAMAQLAAKIDTEVRQRGRAIPFADLLIGATALRFRLRGICATSKCLPTWRSSGSEATPSLLTFHSGPRHQGCASPRQKTARP